MLIIGNLSVAGTFCPAEVRKGKALAKKDPEAHTILVLVTLTLTFILILNIFRHKIDLRNFYIMNRTHTFL
jgi:hypothetical protein